MGHVERDVEVGAPEGGVIGGFGVEGGGEVGIAADGGAGLVLNAGLVEVDRIAKVTQAAEGGGRGIGFDGGTELDFGETNPRFAEAIQAVGRGHEFDGHVAGVEANPDVAAEHCLGRGLRTTGLGDEAGDANRQEDGFEKADDVGRGFQEAVGFGLESEMDFASGVTLECVQGEGCVGEVMGKEKVVSRATVPCLIGEGDGADTAVESFREEGGKQAGEAEGIGLALGGAPVGRIDGRLDGGSMKVAVGKAVDGEDIKVLVG